MPAWTFLDNDFLLQDTSSSYSELPIVFAMFQSKQLYSQYTTPTSVLKTPLHPISVRKYQEIVIFLMEQFVLLKKIIQKRDI